MKKTIIGILVIISILVIAVFAGKSAGLFAITDTTTISGGTYVCGNYYQTPSPLQEIKSYCETKEYVCEIDFYKVGSFGDIDKIQCQKLCTICDDEKDNWWGELALYAESNNDCISERVSRSDYVKYTDGALSETQVLDKYCGVPPPPPQQLTCYACDGAREISKIFTGSCGNGYIENQNNLDCQAVTPPPPPPDTVTCFTCSNEQILSNSFDNSCPDGWGENRPNTCTATNTVDCYLCDGTASVKNTIIGTSCPQQLSPTPLNCQQDIKTCSFCEGSNLQVSQYQNECPQGQDEYPLDGSIPTCGFVDVVEGYFDFENEPVQSGILLGAIGLLLYAVISTLFGMKRDNVGGTF